MEKRSIRGRLLTPMFSCGAYNGIENRPAEIRVTELKGIMRYLYRIACPSGLNVLLRDESDLFGGSANQEENQGHASPIQLIEKNVPSGKYVCCKEKLLLHKNNEGIRCLTGGTLEFELRRNKRISVQDEKPREIADLDWYRDLADLALVLCGMGKRSRKGRGRVMPEEFRMISETGQEEVQVKRFPENKEEALAWICGHLNRIAGATTQEMKCPEGFYKIEKEGDIWEIGACFEESVRESKRYRPVIRKIRLGRLLSAEKEGKDGGKGSLDSKLTDYLQRLDQTCHEVDQRYNKMLKAQKNGETVAAGLKREAGVIWEATGTGGRSGRFASPLIVGFIETKEGIYPVYTFVTAVRTVNKGHGQNNRASGGGNAAQNDSGYREVDEDLKAREAFIRLVEKKERGR